MRNVRIIARLDIKGPNLVKGIHLEGLRVLGRPEDFSAYYYAQGADELMYQDVVASLYDRNSLHEIVTRTAEQRFIPLTVGGGIRTISDIREVLRAGADKVAINTAAIKDPNFVREAARKFGSSTIVVALEVIRTDGQYFCFTENGREHTGIEAIGWAERLADLGAGELILTSVDQEGTGNGCDLELIQAVSSRVSIPVIAHGGVGKPAHVAAAVHAGADALAVASVLHYGFLRYGRDWSAIEGGEGNIDFLKSGRNFDKITPMSVADVKAALAAQSIPCRPSI